MPGSPFLELAERRDLDYAEHVAPEADGRFPFPRGEVGEVVGGALPGGCEGLVARLRQQADAGESPVELVIVVAQVPESVDFARFISCREAGFRGVVSRAIGPGGLGWIQEFSFESIEFNRRYRVNMLRTGKENRLRQLFSPTFLDWMAHTAPEGLYFDLVSGVLTVTLEGGSVGDAADVERACELAGKIAERVRSEALEGIALDDARNPDADAALAASEARFAALVERAGFPAPPEDVASALERIGPALKREKGFMSRLLGSSDSTEARMMALTAVLRAYADRAGLEPDYPDQLHELLPFFDRFPMSVMRHLSLRGAGPGAGAAGSLVAFADLAALGSGDRLSYRPAFEVETNAGDRGFVHVLPRGQDDRRHSTVFGGFVVALGEGSRRETESSRREREQAEELAEALGNRFLVAVHRPAGVASIGDAGRAWLSGGGGDAFVEAGGRLTLVGATRPVIDWSFKTLDEFRSAVAPVIAEVVAA